MVASPQKPLRSRARRRARDPTPTTGPPYGGIRFFRPATFRANMLTKGARLREGEAGVPGARRGHREEGAGGMILPDLLRRAAERNPRRIAQAQLPGES